MTKSVAVPLEYGALLSLGASYCRSHSAEVLSFPCRPLYEAEKSIRTEAKRPCKIRPVYHLSS